MTRLSDAQVRALREIERGNVVAGWRPCPGGRPPLFLWLFTSDVRRATFLALLRRALVAYPSSESGWVPYELALMAAAGTEGFWLDDAELWPFLAKPRLSGAGRRALEKHEQETER